MKPKILSLDMGGTSVKARIYSGNQVEKETSWMHDYRDCGLEKAKIGLVSKVKEFSGGKVDAVGLGIAGLIATNNSLYRSTVLTSFEKFNLLEFLKEELKAKAATIDNDADCGAISQKYFTKSGENGFLYVVVGSGIGSAYVDSRGELPYLKRFDPNHQFSKQDNPLANDLGQRAIIPKKEVCRKLQDYEIDPEELEKVIGHKTEIEIGNLASAVGMKTILEMLFSGRKGILEEWYYYKIGQFQNGKTGQKLDPRLNEITIAKSLSYFAESSDYYAVAAFELLGYFLGYGIAEAEKIIKEEKYLGGFPEIYLSGPIMNSFNYFQKELRNSLLKKKVNCTLRLSRDLSGSNLHGAYLRAKEVLEQRR